jgi:hypothetical protein
MFNGFADAPVSIEMTIGVSGLLSLRLKDRFRGLPVVRFRPHILAHCYAPCLTQHQLKDLQDMLKLNHRFTRTIRIKISLKMLTISDICKVDVLSACAGQASIFPCRS